MRIARGSVIGLAGAVGAGVLAWPAAAAYADTEQVRAKRDEQAIELVAVSDDDEDTNDDDTNDRASRDRASRDRDTRTRDTRTRDTRSRDTRSRTGNSNDATGSRHTAVSRDRDRSRGDKTRDWTRDGAGDRTRDRSAGHTNDKSRNDTRRKR